MYKHLFFDLDNTVTRSRTEITLEMESVLKKAVLRGMDVIIVSGARVEQSKKQMKNFPAIYLGQNGNDAEDDRDEKSVKLWVNKLNEEERSEIMAHIKSIPRTWPVSDEGDLIQDRGSQVSYSLLGHNENLEKKEAFDPDFSRRKKILLDHPFNSKNLDVKMGGTTCLDYFQKGKNKGFNIGVLLKKMNWQKEECVYAGDALFPGGNDDTVIGVIHTKPVKDPEETLAFLKSFID